MKWLTLDCLKFNQNKLKTSSQSLRRYCVKDVGKNIFIKSFSGRSKYIKGATKLYFMRYLFVVIIFYKRVYLSLHFLPIFLEISFSSFCVLCVSCLLWVFNSMSYLLSHLFNHCLCNCHLATCDVAIYLTLVSTHISKRKVCFKRAFEFLFQTKQENR